MKRHMLCCYLMSFAVEVCLLTSASDCVLCCDDVITCDFVSVSYKQCIKILESSANVSSMERDLIYLKCNDAVTCSRRIHSLIQLKYDEARMNNSQQSKNVPLVSSTSSSSCLTQTPSSSSPLSARSVLFYVSLSYLLIDLGK